MVHLKKTDLSLGIVEFWQSPPQGVEVTAFCTVRTEAMHMLQISRLLQIVNCALDGRYGQPCIPGNRSDRRKAGVSLPSPVGQIQIYRDGS